MVRLSSLLNRPVSYIDAINVQTAVQKIVPYLVEDTNVTFYFDGWDGLGASAVLRAIAEHPPPSVLEKFDKIIYIDNSRWTSRRSLQRAIVDEIKLTQQVAADFDRQDEEDDFKGIDQGSRGAITRVATVIGRSLSQFRCLVVFQNGSDSVVWLADIGIPHPTVYRTRIMWTFRGRLGLEKKGTWMVPRSDLAFVVRYSGELNAILAEEAREIALCTDKLGHGVTPEIAMECCLYLLSLDHRGGDVIDYNWTTHASSYWVCDGIVQGGQDNQAWELAHSLQQHIRLEGYSSKSHSQFGSKLDISNKHWISLTSSSFQEVPSGTTSLFFAPGPPLKSRYVSFPSERFHESADQLRVLKLSRCTFSFSSPPFHCCHNLRFLGLDRCMDEQQLEEETGARALETFQRLWVLDVSETDWALDFPLQTEEAIMVATNIREVHVNKGRIWRRHLAWRRLPNLRKLRVVDPTSSWETGRQDEFMDMVKLVLLDLSGNSTIQVLPSLSGATNLKTLILDGCVGLEHVGPQGLPPSLESFCFNSRLGKYDEKKSKISRISLAGCARLADFRLHGSLPNLEELDLSHTAVKMLHLKDAVAVQSLQKVILVGCKQLRSISWSYSSGWHPVKLLCIDTREGGEVTKPSLFDSLMVSQGKGDCCHAFVAVTDMRFLQSVQFLWGWYGPYGDSIIPKLNLCLSSPSKDDGRSCHKKKKKKKKKMGGQVAAGASPLPRSLTYYDASTGHQITAQIDVSSTATTPFQPLDNHMEIGEGVSDVIPNMVSEEARRVICNVMDKVVESLHVHDSSSVTAVTPQHIVASPSNDFGVMNKLRCCRVERCRRLQTVFNYHCNRVNFSELETFWAAHLLMARSIWHNSLRAPAEREFGPSFGKLRAIHLHFCPRLRYVLRLSWNDDLSQLETLHILYCGELRQVFPVEQELQKKIATKHAKGMLAFPKLKYMYLQDLSSLQLICEAKMFAPNLETIYARGCWGLRRLPATDISRRLPVAVDCEKDWWDKLEWDGIEYGHHPSLFQPRHSKYYKKRHLRATVLR